MLSYMPLYYHTSNIIKAILKVQGSEFDSLQQDIKELGKQFFIETATWGLEFWEREFDLPVNPTGLSEEARRSRIKGKIRGIGKVGSSLIKSIAEAYANGEADVGFDGRINITFIGKRGIPQEIEELKKQIGDVVPAHLEVVYNYTYLTWAEFDLLAAWVQESMTWAELEVFKPFDDPSPKLVWDEFDLLALDVQESKTWDQIEVFKQ